MGKGNTTLILIGIAFIAGCQLAQPIPREGVSELEQQILDDLESNDSWKRMQAAPRAAFFQFASAAPAIARMLVDDKTFNCGEVFGHSVTCSEADTAASALVQLGPAAVDAVVPKLRDPRRAVRRRAAEILESINDPRGNAAVARAKRH